MMVRCDTVTRLNLFHALSDSLDNATHLVTKNPAWSITAVNLLQVRTANATRFESYQNPPWLHDGLRNGGKIDLIRIPEKTGVHERTIESDSRTSIRVLAKGLGPGWTGGDRSGIQLKYD